MKNEQRFGMPNAALQVISGLRANHPFLADALFKHKKMLWYKLTHAQKTTGQDAMDIFQDLLIDLWKADKTYPITLYRYNSENYNYISNNKKGFCIIENRKTKKRLEVDPIQIEPVKKVPYSLFIKVKIDQLLANVIAAAACQKRGASIQKVAWGQPVSAKADNDLIYEDIVEDTSTPTPDKEHSFQDYYSNMKDSLSPLAAKVLEYLLKNPPGPSHKIVGPTDSTLRKVLAAKREIRQLCGNTKVETISTSTIYKSLVSSETFNISPIQLSMRSYI